MALGTVSTRLYLGTDFKHLRAAAGFKHHRVRPIDKDTLVFEDDSLIEDADTLVAEASPIPARQDLP